MKGKEWNGMLRKRADQAPSSPGAVLGKRQNQQPHTISSSKSCVLVLSFSDSFTVDEHKMPSARAKPKQPFFLD